MLWLAQQAYYANVSAIFMAQMACMMGGGGSCNYSAAFQAATDSYNVAKKQYAVTKANAELQVTTTE